MNLVFDALKHHIETKIRRERLVFWADTQGSFQRFVEKLEDQHKIDHSQKYKIIRFKGSILENLLDLHPLLQDINKPDCLVYVPFMADEDIPNSPYLETYLCADRVATDAATLLTSISPGFFSPEQLKKLLAALPADFTTLEALLSGHYIDLSIFQDNASVIEFAKRLLSGRITGIDDLKTHPAGTVHAIEKALERLFGFASAYTKLLVDERDIITAKSSEDHALLRLPLAYHLLACEYVNDLTVEPIDRLLKEPGESGRVYLENVHMVLNSLRSDYPDAYRSLANEVEQTGLFDREKEVRKSDELGSIDTFLFEDILHQREAMRLLLIAGFERAEKKAAGRIGSFWYLSDSLTQNFWKWLNLTATFGRQMEKTALEITQQQNLESVLQYYATNMAQVDQMHREFLTFTDTIRHAENAEYKTILAIRSEMLKRYYQWLEKVNFHYQKICETHGYLPVANLQQRNLYHTEFSPLIQSGKTAIFFVDAMRYEVGQHLRTELENAGIESEIKPIFAELPTITAVGMNALVPVVNGGDLTPVFSGDSIRGFKAQSRQVSGPNERRLVLEEITQKRVEWLKLDELFNDYRGDEKKLRAADVVVVHSLEIDEAGETDFLNKGFDFFQETTRRIRMCIEKLQRSQFSQICIVSDHGFIQYEAKSERMLSEIAAPVGSSRRYLIKSGPADHSGAFAAVDLGALNYPNTGKSLMFLRVPRIFRNAGSTGTFFHGGNSLQERVIPLIIVKSTKETLPVAQPYHIKVKDVVVGVSRHQMKLEFERTNDSSLFPAEFHLAIEPVNNTEARVEILSCLGASLNGAEITLSTNATCAIEFQIQVGSRAGISDKVRLRISHTELNSNIPEFITLEAFPVVSFAETIGIASTPFNGTMPLNMPGDVERILGLLTNAGSRAITEQSLTAQFGDSRITQRAIRQFSIFLKERAHELPFDIVIETGPEGKMFKIKGS